MADVTSNDVRDLTRHVAKISEQVTSALAEPDGTLPRAIETFQAADRRLTRRGVWNRRLIVILSLIFAAGCIIGGLILAGQANQRAHDRCIEDQRQSAGAIRSRDVDNTNALLLLFASGRHFTKTDTLKLISGWRTTLLDDHAALAALGFRSPDRPALVLEVEKRLHISLDLPKASPDVTAHGREVLKSLHLPAASRC